MLLSSFCIDHVFDFAALRLSWVSSYDVSEYVHVLAEHVDFAQQCFDVFRVATPMVREKSFIGLREFHPLYLAQHGFLLVVLLKDDLCDRLSVLSRSSRAVLLLEKLVKRHPLLLFNQELEVIQPHVLVEHYAQLFGIGVSLLDSVFSALLTA